MKSVMRNWKFLLKLLKWVNPKYGAEIGVFEGDSSVELLKEFEDLVLYCVDPWENDTIFHKLMPKKQGRILTADMEQTYNFFLHRIKPFCNRAITVRLDSIEAAKTIKDGILDFVFIDGNHAYQYVKEDICAWTPKVRIGGIICGDDYRQKQNYGVIEAVNEIFPNQFHVNQRSNVWYLVKEVEL